jgi:hypothetical protein
VNPFELRACQELSAAIDAIPPDIAADIYALSLYVFDWNDDPRRPMVQLGYNTGAQVQASTPRGDPGPGSPFAANTQEAKWNFAFWLQNELVLIGGVETPSGVLLEQVLKSEGKWYSDEEIESDAEHTYALDPLITSRFVTMLVGVVRHLHADGVIVRNFGRPIPVLVHELEYYGAIARQNERANPGEVANEFVTWIDGMEARFNPDWL